MKTANVLQFFIIMTDNKAYVIGKNVAKAYLDYPDRVHDDDDDSKSNLEYSG